MKQKRVGLGHRLAEFLDIPLETVIDWPRLALSGNRSLTIQNHHWIIEYDQTLVRISTKLGEVKVSGKGLTLVTAYQDEIVIEGQIGGVEFIDWR